MSTPLTTVTDQGKGNPLQQLHAYGQSVWYDNLSRDLLQDGGLQRLITDYGVLGITSNPTIFAKAIAESSLYDDEVRRGIEAGEDAQSIFEHLAVADISAAADLLLPIYENTGGYDGYVSLEVSPTLANDTQGTVAEARRLWDRVARPNLMIKVPATQAGLPAITELIADGINVNVTLIFGLERYREVIEAYLAGLAAHTNPRRLLPRVASVASFFVSRVDTLVDKQLAALAQGDSGANNEVAEALMGKAAIANAKLAYELFGSYFRSERFEALAAQGAQVQRPLWASTSTKNPRYRDVMYVEELIGKDTVNTMPPATLMAFADHGEAQETVTEGLEEAHRVFEQLEALGINMEAVSQQLEDEGVASFAASYAEVLATIDGKRDAVAAAG